MTALPISFQSRPAGKHLPVTLVTGFLGSGKTTLVNHILSNRQGVRAAVLVNEFGEVGIDNDLIVAAGDGMIELSNGCICCSVNNDLVDGVVRVLSRPDPVDHLIVETTGVADPLPVALTFMRPEFRNTLRLDAIVGVADAEQFSLELFDSVAARNQLRRADAIVVNKCDCVDSGRLVDVERQIRSVNPEARLAYTVRSAVPLPLILDVELFRPSLAALRRDEHEHHHHEDHLAADGFVSLSFESRRPFSVSRFQAFLDTGRPPGLFRGKGFLQIAETGKRYIFHLVGGRFSLDVDDHPDRGLNRLVLIGRDLDLDDLRARLQACLADA
jgi:G3E family GTPase